MLLGMILAASGTRVLQGTWILPTSARYTVVALAAAGTIVFLLVRASTRDMIPFFVASFCVFAALALGLVALIEAVFKRILTVSQRLILPLRIGLAFVVLTSLFLVTQDVRIPVPDVSPASGNAASSLKSSAGDLGRFLIACGSPQGLSAELAHAFTQPQVTVSEHIAWGLGIGIQNSGQGAALFHWGRNPSVRATMVYYPSIGIGVVVLANDGWAGDEVADIAIKAIGGTRFWADE
jgi:hypothetical protein